MSPQNIDEVGVYTLGEACKALRMTPDNLTTEIESRGVPHLKVGKSYRLRGSDLLDLVAGRNWREEGKRGSQVDKAGSRIDSKARSPLEASPNTPRNQLSQDPLGTEKRRVYRPQEQRQILAEYVRDHPVQSDGSWKWEPGLGPNDYFVRTDGSQVKVRTIRSWRDKGVTPATEGRA